MKEKNVLAEELFSILFIQSSLQQGLDPSKYSTHKLRHTAATLMYQYGQVDIRGITSLIRS